MWHKGTTIITDNHRPYLSPLPCGVCVCVRALTCVQVDPLVWMSEGQCRVLPFVALYLLKLLCLYVCIYLFETGLSVKLELTNSRFIC